MTRSMQKAKVVTGVCVPYGAGMNQDRDTIYIDKRIPKAAWPFIEIHETAEAAIMHLLGIKYQKAHLMATAAEHEAVRQAGFDPAEYEQSLKAALAAAEHDWKGIPDDLDMEPYLDSGEHELVRKMLGGAG